MQRMSTIIIKRHDKESCKNTKSSRKARLTNYPKEVIVMIKSIVIIVALVALIAIIGFVAIMYIFNKSSGTKYGTSSTKSILKKKDAHEIMDLLEILDDLNNSD